MKYSPECRIAKFIIFQILYFKCFRNGFNVSEGLATAEAAAGSAVSAKGTLRTEPQLAQFLETLQQNTSAGNATNYLFFYHFRLVHNFLISKTLNYIRHKKNEL